MLFAELPMLTSDQTALAAATPFLNSGAAIGSHRLINSADSAPFALRNRQSGNRHNNVLSGRGGDDLLRGRGGNDLLRGFAGNDRLFGEQGDDKLLGGAGNDFLDGGSGRNQLLGEAGQDQLLGGKQADQLLGGADDDVLQGGGGQDRLTGGAGRDRFGLATGAAQLKNAARITDFNDGVDSLELAGLRFADLAILQGTGQQSSSTLIQNKLTGETLVILQNIQSNQITTTDFGISSTPNQPVPISTPTPALGLQTNTIKFSAGSSEAEIAATGAARIQIGTQTLYIGTQQVSSNNQNPVIVSFDAENPANNWVRTDYEITGTDGRGYGLFWSGSQLYAVFSVDGTQGTPDQDFRRVSAAVNQSWLRSYGAGGGAKVAVLARLNPATGEMTDAVYLSAILSSGKSNSLAINNLSTNATGNLVVKAESYFAPRRPDGQAMTQTTPGSSPFDYTLEITPDLKTVTSTSAVGWS